MKKLHLLLSSILFGSFTSALATPYDCVYLGPQVILTGLAGAGPLARADIIAPFARGCDSLFFGDLQGEYGQHHAWYGGGGLAYRKIIDPTRLVGGYLFYDTNESKHSNYFHVLSPGVEMISTTWDARVTGYLPVDARTKKDGRNIPPFSDSCGVNVNNDIIEFAGHQEFVGLFSNLEQVGPGLDGEVGYTFARANNLQVHAGGYYFHLRDFSDIKGVEGRIGVPFTPQIKLVAEAGYDNQQRGRIVAGLEFRIGGPRRVDTCNIATHLEDPIMRNLGTVGRGNGIPILSKRVDEGRLVIRDDIFFFSPTGTAVLGAPDAGTFENPFAPTQFSQATVDNIFITTGDGNLYFATGTYTIAGPAAPNEVVTLHDSQSLFGRTSDFRSSAVGAERPILLGGLIFEGNNSLNSIQLINSLVNTGSGRVVAIDMADAPGNQICNSFIQANSTFTGDLTGFNIAIGIHANNSELAIETSTVEANASVIGTITGGLNAAAGIGAIGGVAGTATGGEDVLGVGIFALGTDGADGIGTQGADGAAFNQAILFGNAPDGFSSNVTDSFDGNTFTLFETIVNSTADVTGEISSGLNAAVGIGSIGGIGGIAGVGGLNGGISTATVTAGDGGNGLGAGGIGGTGGDSTLSIILGDAGNGGDALASASFNDNIFSIDSSEITATVNADLLDGASANLAAAIGTIGGLGGTAGSGGDSGSIFAAVTGGDGGDGVVAGAGGAGGSAVFTGITGDGGNGGEAVVLGTFLGNDFTVTNTDLLVTANALDLALGLNASIGIGSISGVGGIAGSGGAGGSVVMSSTAGAGGNAAVGIEEPGTSGGLAGGSTAVALTGNGGNGGRAAAVADFSGNTFALSGNAILITSNVTNSVVDFVSANLANGIGNISGLTGIGGDGAIGGDILATTIGGDGGDVDADGTGGDGGLGVTVAITGLGGVGGSANSTSIFGNNDFSATAYTINTLASVGGELNSTLNASVGLGSIAGIANIAGNGADGSSITGTTTAGDGGDATNVGSVGGDGGDASATLLTNTGGNGGSSSISAIFAANTLSFVDGSIATDATAATNTGGFNTTVAIGAVGGIGGIAGDGGLAAAIAIVDTNGVDGGGAGTPGTGGTASTIAPGSGAGNGGSSAVAGIFANNTLTASGDLASTATVGLNTNALNVSIGVGGVSGIQGLDGVSPVGGGTGGSGDALSLVNGNTMTLDSITSTNTAVVTANTGVSLNEAIGIGTDPLQFFNTEFEDNLVDVSGASWAVGATVETNNDLFSTNKALGLFAGNGTVINYFDSDLVVAANVLGVNLGTNTTQFTQTAGTGIINF